MRGLARLDDIHYPLIIDRILSILPPKLLIKLHLVSRAWCLRADRCLAQHLVLASPHAFERTAQSIPFYCGTIYRAPPVWPLRIPFTLLAPEGCTDDDATGPHTDLLNSVADSVRVLDLSPRFEDHQIPNWVSNLKHVHTIRDYGNDSISRRHHCDHLWVIPKCSVYVCRDAVPIFKARSVPIRKGGRLVIVHPEVGSFGGFHSALKQRYRGLNLEVALLLNPPKCEQPRKNRNGNVADSPWMRWVTRVSSRLAQSLRQIKDLEHAPRITLVNLAIQTSSFPTGALDQKVVNTLMYKSMRDVPDRKQRFQLIKYGTREEYRLRVGNQQYRLECPGQWREDLEIDQFTRWGVRAGQADPSVL